ncbi:unnamed protein product [Protopolystoma xenopodis]|uniref:Uncharacterized protein n=1 Tax=Protopolystoma xenopodis TaxID=117903 RepID=A0A448WKN4_9PLAT|nr:unnamed protein product [Protopolystoma xenopodis]
MKRSLAEEGLAAEHLSRLGRPLVPSAPFSAGFGPVGLISSRSSRTSSIRPFLSLSLSLVLSSYRPLALWRRASHPPFYGFAVVCTPTRSWRPACASARKILPPPFTHRPARRCICLRSFCLSVSLSLSRLAFFTGGAHAFTALMLAPTAVPIVARSKRGVSNIFTS